MTSVLLSLRTTVTELSDPIVSHFNPYYILGTVIIAAIVALPAMYYWFSVDGVDAPPYLSVLYPLVSGQIDLKSEGPIGLVKYGYKHLGDIFRFRVLHQPITMMIGPEANRCVFEAKDSVLSQKECYSFTIPVFGKGIVYDSPSKLFMQQLKMIGKGLSAFTMSSYSGKIVAEAEAYFANWPDEGEVDLFKELSDLLILTASRCLLGSEIRENVQTEFAELYQELSDGMNHLTYFFPNAPTTRHRKRDAARAKLVKIFSEVIQQRRKNGSPLKENDWDFLQILIDARYTDGNPLSDEEISGMLIAALFAGQHTSNITSTWVGLEVLSQKETLLPRILAEQDRVLSSTNGEITLEALSEMELLHNCMKEALRLHPPLILLMRKALEPIQYKGYTIPKGDMVVVCPPVSHSLPEVFSNPEKFDPDRFAEPRCEDQKHKFSYLAFGGGRHGCLGERFGYLQVKTVWSILFRKFEFELCAPHPKSDYTTIVIGPTPPCPIRFRRRK